jgi:mRNA interferase MazF
VKSKYVPKKGDFVALTFDPQSGHEQKGRRPALVISNTFFNSKTGLAIVCPITNTDRHFPLHVAVPNSSVLTGFVMVDQVKSIDFNSRRAKFIEKAESGVLDEVLAILDACIYDD